MTICKGKDGGETVMNYPITYVVRRSSQKTADELRDWGAKKLIKAFQTEGHVLNMQVQVYSREWELLQPLMIHRIQAE